MHECCDESVLAECKYSHKWKEGEDCNAMLLADAADAIEELISRVPKWIDANERLPEQTGEYIVLIKASKKWIDAGEDVLYTTVMWFVKEQKVWKEMNGDDSYNAVLSAVDTDWACSVTHWMQLPEPPNCGEKMKTVTDCHTLDERRTV